MANTPNKDPSYIELMDLLPPGSHLDPAYRSSNYGDWEKKTAQPILERKGWTIREWADGERDRFGPLTRYAVGTLNGREFRLIYG